MVSPQLEVVIHSRREQNEYYLEALGDQIHIQMMKIPAGRFMLGSPDEEEGRTDWEGPQKEVVLSEFFLGKHPITQAQWRQVSQLPQIKFQLELDPSRLKGDLRPVESINWLKAVEFCDRLAKKTGYLYRLPTEAEWEYACRAGTTTPFHFGETITTDVANYCGIDDAFGELGSYAEGPNGQYRKQTTDVNNFQSANALGLHDMHGNVLEWCQDHWHKNYANAPLDGSVWLTDNENDPRVIRGGSWGNYPGYCRSAYRNHFNPVNSDDDLGFRVACSAPRT